MSQRNLDPEARIDKEISIVADSQNAREAHVTQESVGLGGPESHRPFHPVGKGDRPAEPQKTGGLDDQRILALHVAPGILAPDEISTPTRKARRARVAEHERDPVVKPLAFAKLTSTPDDLLGRVYADHPRN